MLPAQQSDLILQISLKFWELQKDLRNLNEYYLYRILSVSEKPEIHHWMFNKERDKNKISEGGKFEKKILRHTHPRIYWWNSLTEGSWTSTEWDY